MLELKKDEKGIEIKNSNNFEIALLVIGLLVIFLSIIAVICIATNKSFDAVEISVFVALFVFIVIMFGYAYIDRTRLLTVNDNGVQLKSVLGSKSFPWEEIKDFGTSYYCKSKNATYYCLYFSREKLKSKNDYSKKLKGEMIKFVFIQSEYKLLDDLISYCSKRALIEPFIAKEKD